MAAIPSLEEEEAKRPSRERENLVGERTRIGNRIKSALARLGIRGFGRPCARPRSGSSGCPRRKASRCRLTHWPSCGERARLRLLTDQIREIETARLQRLEQRLYCGVHPMVRLLARVRSLGIGTADRSRGVLARLARPPGGGALWRSDRLADGPVADDQHRAVLVTPRPQLEEQMRGVGQVAELVE
jgi:transposase